MGLFDNVNVQVDGCQDYASTLKTYGTIVLKPNIVDNRNILTQAMLSKKNTKYVIRWDYEIEGEIEVPENCLIEFDGGSISDGKLIGQNTRLVYDISQEEVIKDTVMEGTFIYSTPGVDADEKDLTSQNGVLELKNKDYNPEVYSGLGRVYLKNNAGKEITGNYWMFKKSTDEIVYLMYRYKGIDYNIYDSTTGKGLVLENNIVKETENYNVNNLPESAREHSMSYGEVSTGYVVTLPDNSTITSNVLNQTEMYVYTTPTEVAGANILTQEMMSKENTIYIIQYDFDLNGETITVPEGSILKFEGGSLKNGNIFSPATSQNSPMLVFNRDKDKIFVDVTILGKFKYGTSPVDGDTIKVDSNGNLELADRVWGEDEGYSKGYIILKKDKPFADQIDGNPNTIFEIRYDFDLGGEEVEIPEGCVLKFEGGSLRNGTLVGNGTELVNLKKSFKNVILDSTFVSDALTEYSLDRNSYSSDTDFINQILKIKSSEVVFKEGEYSLDIKEYSALTFYDNSNVDFGNSTFTLKGNSYSEYAIFQIAGVNNVTIKNFTIVGDVESHTGITGEWGHGIHISNSSKNITIQNGNIYECWGDGIDIIEYLHLTDTLIGPPINITIDNCKCYRNRRQGCSIEAGKHIKIINSEFRYTGELGFTAPGSGIDIEPFSVNHAYTVEDILIKNCVITDNCKNSPTSGLAEFKILANTNEESIYKGFNDIKVENCTCGYTEVKDTYGVSIENTTINSLLFYNGSDLKLVNSNLGILYIQDWKNIKIFNNTINSENTPQFGWRTNDTLSIIGFNCTGILQNNTIKSYVSGLFTCSSDVKILNNIFIQYYEREEGDTSREVQIDGYVSLLASNYFEYSTKFEIVVRAINPLVSKNIFVGPPITLTIASPVQEGYDISFVDNFSKNALYNPQNVSCSIYSFGNNYKTTNNRTKVINESFVTIDNNIKTLVSTDENGKCYPLALLQAVRNSTAFYETRLEEGANTVMSGYANDISIPVIWNGTDWVGYDGKQMANRVGGALNRPSLGGAYSNRGFTFFDISLEQPIYWNGTLWLNKDGIGLTDVTKTKGSTTEMHTMEANLTFTNNGLRFFDTDLNKWYTFNGANGHMRFEDEKGYYPGDHKGANALRTSLTANLGDYDEGYDFYDTDLNKILYFGFDGDNKVWRDATGTPV